MADNRGVKLYVTTQGRVKLAHNVTFVDDEEKFSGLVRYLYHHSPSCLMGLLIRELALELGLDHHQDLAALETAFSRIMRKWDSYVSGEDKTDEPKT